MIKNLIFTFFILVGTFALLASREIVNDGEDNRFHRKIDFTWLDRGHYDIFFEHIDGKEVFSFIPHAVTRKKDPYPLIDEQTNVGDNNADETNNDEQEISTNNEQESTSTNNEPEKSTSTNNAPEESTSTNNEPEESTSTKNEPEESTLTNNEPTSDIDTEKEQQDHIEKETEVNNQ